MRDVKSEGSKSAIHASERCARIGFLLLPLLFAPSGERDAPSLLACTPFICRSKFVWGGALTATTKATKQQHSNNSPIHLFCLLRYRFVSCFLSRSRPVKACECAFLCCEMCPGSRCLSCAALRLSFLCARHHPIGTAAAAAASGCGGISYSTQSEHNQVTIIFGD